MFEAKVENTSLYAWGKAEMYPNPKDPNPVSSRGDKERARNVCPRLTTETEHSLTAMRARGRTPRNPRPSAQGPRNPRPGP